MKDQLCPSLNERISSVPYHKTATTKIPTAAFTKHATYPVTGRGD